MTGSVITSYSIHYTKLYDTGKIAIAKYGRSWRGIKPKLAGEKGAIGTIIYSDPADDGYGQGDVYPDGPFKNESGVQRGSVMDMPTYPGDVLTPGEGATADARRLRRSEAPTITKIPVLPISYRDAFVITSYSIHYTKLYEEIFRETRLCRGDRDAC